MQDRVMGIETEYGLAVKQKDAHLTNPVGTASWLLNYLWLKRNSVFTHLKPFKKTECIWLGSNGGKLYVDTGNHLEYASPECRDAGEIVLYDRAGDLIVRHMIELFLRSRTFKTIDDGAYSDILCTKNNSDFVREISTAPIKEAHFYGSHENYLMKRGVLFEEHQITAKKIFQEKFIPFLASRVILHGAGGMWFTPGIGWHYVVSPRALLVETFFPALKVSTAFIHETAVMPKNAGHEHYTRLQIQYADSNMSDYSTFLRFGTTHLALRLIEELRSEITPPILTNPIKALHTFASDPTLTKKAVATDGNEYTAIELQKYFVAKAHKLRLSLQEKEILSCWEHTLKKLEEDPESVSDELDWAIKRQVLSHLVEQKSLTLQHESARMISVCYHDLQANGIYNRLRSGGLVKTLVSTRGIMDAVLHPPRNTRASLRAHYINVIRQYRYMPWSVDIDWHYVHHNPQFFIRNPREHGLGRLKKFLKKNFTRSLAYPHLQNPYPKTPA